jgi:tetrahydromethanopterin S-methyltransferase subunit E
MKKKLVAKPVKTIIVAVIVGFTVSVLIGCGFGHRHYGHSNYQQPYYNDGNYYRGCGHGGSMQPSHDPSYHNYPPSSRPDAQ